MQPLNFTISILPYSIIQSVCELKYREDFDAKDYSFVVPASFSWSFRPSSNWRHDCLYLYHVHPIAQAQGLNSTSLDAAIIYRGAVVHGNDGSTRTDRLQTAAPRRKGAGLSTLSCPHSPPRAATVCLLL